MRCLACGKEMGERNVCQVCGTPRKNVLCDMGVVSEDPGTEVMYENMNHYVLKTETTNQYDVEEETDDVDDSSVIPDCVVDVDKKEKKKSQVKFKIILFSILGIILISGIVVFFAIKYMKFRASLPEYTLSFYDEEKDIMYDENLVEQFRGKNDLKYSDVNADNTRLIFLKDRILSTRTSDGDKIIDELVVNYIGASSCDNILYAKYEDTGISVTLQTKDVKIRVLDGLLNIDNLIVSENGQYFSFSTSWSYVTWVKDNTKPAGGEYVTVTVTEIYSVNKVGDYKLRVQSENEIKANYITNSGELIYSDYTEDVMCSELDSSVNDISCAADAILYNEDKNSAMFITTLGECVYWDRNEEILKVVSSNIENVYYIDSNKGFCDLVGLESSGYTNTDVMCLFYTKGENKYFINLETMSDATFITNQEFDFEKIFYVEIDNFLYGDESVTKYSLEGDTWNFEQVDKKYHNRCGRGYLTFENGQIFYNYKGKPELVCEADKVLEFVGEWIYYRKDGCVFKIDMSDEESAQQLFDREVQVIVNYK